MSINPTTSTLIKKYIYKQTGYTVFKINQDHTSGGWSYRAWFKP